MKYRCAGEVGALMGAIFYAAFGGENRTTGLRPRKTGQPRCARGNAFPLWWLAPPPFPLFEGALWMLHNGAMSLQESIERFILPTLAGEVRRSRIRGSRAAANHQNANQAL